MDSRRQLKIGSLIKEAFTEILSREGKNVYGKAFVTLTNVTVTSDLTLARFYLSIFNAEDADEVVKRFTAHKYELKRSLAEKLRHHLRRIPEIEFFKDETLDYAYRIEEVFKKISDENKELEIAKAEPVKAKKAVKPRAKSAPKGKTK